MAKGRKSNPDLSDSGTGVKESRPSAIGHRLSRNGYVFDDRYLLHQPGSRHPESPKRLIAIRKALEDFGIRDRWRTIEPRPARLEQLQLVHHPAYVERVERAGRHAPALLDIDTGVSAESYSTALLAAGGVLACVDTVCSGELRRTFAFVRPPGHHAETERAMGFCLFNNIAIAAAYSRLEYRLDRVAVVDFDVHHGNGTQACFYDNPNVLFISSHQFPFYPGTGDFNESGINEGRGFTVNFPLPEGADDSTFVPIYSRLVAQILDQYQPQLILVSAGFDAHFLDPLAGLQVSHAGFGSVAASLIRAAERNCDGRICFVLEGGYSAEALQDCTRAVLTEMELDDPHELLPISESPLFQDILSRVRDAVGERWHF